MEYVCVESRFLFFNGIDRFTVEFSYGLMKWFIFKEDSHTDAVYVSLKIDSKKNKSPNREEAETILFNYLNQ